MTQKLKILIIAITIVVPLGGFFIAAPVSADTPDTTLKPSDCKLTGVSEKGPTKGKVCKVDTKLCSSNEAWKKDDSVCRKLPSDCSSKKLDEDKNECVPLGSDPVALKDNPIVKDLNLIVGFLSGLVGVVVVGVIILGGIQYAMAGDKAEAVSAAKKRISNGVLALVAFLFIFAFLQWLIPGGIFK